MKIFHEGMTGIIKSSISNNEIKRIKSLSHKKFRDEYGLFTVEGEKMVEEALRSGYVIEAVYRREDIGEDAMSRISRMSSPPPVLAVIRKPEETDPGIPGNGLYRHSGCSADTALFHCVESIPVRE